MTYLYRSDWARVTRRLVEVELKRGFTNCGTLFSMYMNKIDRRG